MAANVFNITQEHNQSRIHLHGDMSVSFNQEVSGDFLVGFFTTTSDYFSLDSTAFKFKDLTGTLVAGLVVGGQPGCFIELMFDTEAETWFITANNLIGSNGPVDSVNSLERTLNFLPSPTATPINYALGRQWRGKITADAKLANPVGMKPGDHLKIVIEQDAIGNRKLTYEAAYGFQEAQIPLLSIIAQKVDILDCYMTADRTLQCDLRKDYSIVKPIAYGVDFGFTMQSVVDAAQASSVNGQNVQVIRDGWRLESNTTIGYLRQDIKLRLRGILRADGSYPTLRLDKSDRPAFGKALVNVEGGTVVVENLKLAGASSYADGNATGVLINGNVDYVLVQNVHLLENENGMRSSNHLRPRYDVNNVFFQRNGWAANPSHAGQSHSIYAGPCAIWRSKNSTYYDPIAGHNIKSRAHQLELRQVYSRKSNMGRDMDIPDQGIVHAYDCVFYKEFTAGQNNLIGIGYECMEGFGRTQEYFFFNCYFHNDVDPGRAVTFLANRARTNLNTVAVHFVDCLFGGKALTKTQYFDTLIEGPYTISLTGGPLGPRVPVGSSHMLWNPTEMDPNATTNPTRGPITPFANLPTPTVLEPTPPYPQFINIPVVPPLPSFDSDEPDVAPVADEQAPVVDLVADTTSISQVGSVKITANASDNVGISKVEFYENDVLLFTDNSVPYTITKNLTYADNGTRRFKAIAYDFSNNSTTSNEVVVTVDIPEPITRPAKVLATAVQTVYDAAIAAGAVGSKRAAAAVSLQQAFGDSQFLRIYRSGLLISTFLYTDSVEIVNNGHDVYIKPANAPLTYENYHSGDLASGDWWYEFTDGVDADNVISGSVGLVGSGADLILDQNPAADVIYNVDFKFVIPRPIDQLT